MNNDYKLLTIFFYLVKMMIYIFWFKIMHSICQKRKDLIEANSPECIQSVVCMRALL